MLNRDVSINRLSKTVKQPQGHHPVDPAGVHRGRTAIAFFVGVVLSACSLTVSDDGSTSLGGAMAGGSTGVDSTAASTTTTAGNSASGGVTGSAVGASGGTFSSAGSAMGGGAGGSSIVTGGTASVSASATGASSGGQASITGGASNPDKSATGGANGGGAPLMGGTTSIDSTGASEVGGAHSAATGGVVGAGASAGGTGNSMTGGTSAIDATGGSESTGGASFVSTTSSSAEGTGGNTSSTPADEQTQTIGPEGGTIKAGAVELAIAPGALVNATSITLRRQGNSTAWSLDDLYQMSPDGLHFNAPVRFTLALGEEGVGATTNVEQRWLGYVEPNGTFTAFATPLAVPAQGVFSATLVHFSSGGAINPGGGGGGSSCFAALDSSSVQTLPHPISETQCSRLSNHFVPADPETGQPLASETTVTCELANPQFSETAGAPGQICVRLTGGNAAARTLVEYHTWQDAPAACKQAYDAFLCKLATHEAQHIQIGEQICRDAFAAVAFDTVGCGNTLQQARSQAALAYGAKVRPYVEAAQSRQDAIDTGSGHGVEMNCGCDECNDPCMVKNPTTNSCEPLCKGSCQQCVNGQCVASDCTPPRQATAWGDPHMVTWDGRLYDFQRVGEFVLASDGADWTVQVRLAPYRDSTNVATIVAVAANVDGDRVEIAPGSAGPVLRVNGAATGETTLSKGGQLSSNTLTWANGSVVTFTNQGDHLDLKLSVPQSMSVRGLLGDTDSDPDDDLRLRDDTVIQLPVAKADWQTFADAWRISQSESLFSYLPATDTTTFTDTAFPYTEARAANLPPADYAAAKQVCAGAEVGDPALLEACILDVATTGDPQFAAAAATVPSPIASSPSIYDLAVDPQSLIADEVSKSGDPTADGSADGIIDVIVNGPLVALILLTTDANGVPQGGQQWDTLVSGQIVPADIRAPISSGGGTWVLGVQENGVLLNATDGALTPLSAGAHQLKLYAGNSGYFTVGQHFRVYAVAPDGSSIAGPLLVY